VVEKKRFSYYNHGKETNVVCIDNCIVINSHGKEYLIGDVVEKLAEYEEREDDLK
jgi:hypothetical protein